VGNAQNGAISSTGRLTLTENRLDARRTVYVAFDADLNGSSQQAAQSLTAESKAWTLAWPYWPTQNPVELMCPPIYFSGTETWIIRDACAPSNSSSPRAANCISFGPK
jgi:hypothetical protein